jgi:Right handed beta helix region
VNRLALVLAALLLPAAVAADPVTIHVDAVNGSDAGDGSDGAPLATIGAALGLAMAGDSIAVAAGVYDEPVVMKDDVDLAGSGAELRGAVQCANAHLIGFLLTEVIDCRAGGRIERNLIRSRVEVAETGGVDVTGNLFLTNGALRVATATDVRITGNTFFGSLGIELEAGAEATIANNVLAHGFRGIELADGAVAEIRHNDVFDNQLGIIGFPSDYVGLPNQTGLSGNVSIEPSFVDPDEGDFRLRTGSPLLDAGANPDVSSSEDFDGSLRVLDGDGDAAAVVDMGASEFDPAEVLPLDVGVDVLPRKHPNEIALKKLVSPKASKHKLDVAILSEGTFKAPTEVDATTVRLGSKTALRCRAKDGDRDHVTDLICSFPLDSIELGSWPIEVPPACVRGELLGGRKLLGCDEVEILP